MVLAKLTVDFSGAYHLNYTTRGDFICLTFYNCPHWQKATSVSWHDLPTYKFAMFYETDVCHAGGKFTARSDYTTDGTVKFDSAKAIRSVMIGFFEFERRPSRITYACPIDKDEEHARFNGTAANATAVSDVDYDNGSVRDGGLSSNWYDALPNQ